MLVNGSDFYCGNSSNNLCQFALKNQIPSAYVHPTTKQCNYSVDTSTFALKSEALTKYSMPNITRDFNGRILVSTVDVVGHITWSYRTGTPKDDTFTWSFTLPYPIYYFGFNLYGSSGGSRGLQTSVVTVTDTAGNVLYENTGFYNNSSGCNGIQTFKFKVHNIWDGGGSGAENHCDCDVQMLHNSYY